MASALLGRTHPRINPHAATRGSLARPPRGGRPVLTTILIAVLALLLYLTLVGYNQLIKTRNRTREAWSDIEVQLRRRASLIPSLIETVRAYAQHERETLEGVTSARSALQAAGGASEAATANNALTQALGRLFALVESVRTGDNVLGYVARSAPFAALRAANVASLRS